MSNHPTFLISLVHHTSAAGKVLPYTVGGTGEEPAFRAFASSGRKAPVQPGQNPLMILINEAFWILGKSNIVSWAPPAFPLIVTTWASSLSCFFGDTSSFQVTINRNCIDVLGLGSLVKFTWHSRWYLLFKKRWWMETIKSTHLGVFGAVSYPRTLTAGWCWKSSLWLRSIFQHHGGQQNLSNIHFNMLNMLRTTNKNPNKKTLTKENSSQPSLHYHLLQPVSFQKKLWASQLQAARSTKDPVEPQAG